MKTDNESKASIDNAVEFAREIVDRIEKERLHLPYRMNIIDELHANENAHTRILLQLLRYKTNGVYPILSSFLEMANGLMDGAEDELIDTEIAKPEIVFGQNYIDGSILGNGQCVIIENKIHDAADQNAQIERYIDSILETGTDKGRIFVIYLTRNGLKEVQGFSLTKKAKKVLDCSDENSGRFIRMNYRDHIIRWLREEVLPNCCIKEELLISAIRQYVDHLEGLTRTRLSDKDMNDEIKNYIIGKFGLNSSSRSAQWNALNQECDKVQTALNTIYEVKKDLTDSAYRQIESMSKAFWGGVTSSNDEWRINTRDTFIQILYSQWHSNIHFEWWPVKVDEFAKENVEFKFGFHMEGGYSQHRKAVKDALYDTLKAIPGIVIFEDPGDKVKHGSALFEKTYSFGSTPFLDASDSKKEEFFRTVYNEYVDFFRAFARYYQQHIAKK